MLNADGTGKCNRCGVDLPNTGVGYAVTVMGMREDGTVWTGHWCTTSKVSEGGTTPWPSCAASVITEQTVAYAVGSGENVPEFFDQNAVQEPPDEPEPTPDDGDVTVPAPPPPGASAG